MGMEFTHRASPVNQGSLLVIGKSEKRYKIEVTIYFTDDVTGRYIYFREAAEMERKTASFQSSDLSRWHLQCLRQKLTHMPPRTKEVIASWIRPDGGKCLVILGSRGR